MLCVLVGDDVLGVARGLVAFVLSNVLGFRAEIADRVAADDKNVRLLLHVVLGRIAEHNVDAVDQFHLDRTAMNAERAAVGNGFGVEIEVRGVVTCLRTVKQGFADAVVHLEFFKQVSYLRRCVNGDIHVGVFLRRAVVVGQRFKGDRRCAGSQGRDEQGSDTLENVEDGLRQLRHRRRFGKV